MKKVIFIVIIFIFITTSLCYAEWIGSDEPNVPIAVGLTREDLNFTNVKELAFLIGTGRVYPVKYGTECFVLRRGLFDTKIRIMEGKFINTVGWVRSEFVHED